MKKRTHDPPGRQANLNAALDVPVFMFRTCVYTNLFNVGLIIFILPLTPSTIRENEQHPYNRAHYVCDEDDRNETELETRITLSPDKLSSVV